MAKPLFMLVIVAVVFMSALDLRAQTTEFTYQGSLKDSAALANGTYDLEFALFDSASGGNQIGPTVDRGSLTVTNGIFSAKLDFGDQFPGADRFLEVRVRLSGQPSYTTLTPRQTVNSSPYAVKSVNADNATSATNATNAQMATNSLQLAGVAASQYVLTGDSRLSDARAPTPGSPNYIQNTTTTQTSSNFNISGNGTAGGVLSGNSVNSSTQYNIGGSRALFVGGPENVFAGFFAGQNNSGAENSFFGYQAGQANTTGTDNVIVGFDAGIGNTTGGANSMFGVQAGAENRTGQENTFIGYEAGLENTGSNNTMVGYGAGVGFSPLNLTNATAIGSRATVTQSNSMVLGSISGVANSDADTSIGIGTPSPTNRLDVNVGSSAAVDAGITIQGKSAANGDIGLRIRNTNAGNEWYLDSTGTGSSYGGGGNLAFAIRGSATAAVIIHPSGSLELTHLGTAGGSSLCLNSQNVIAFCSSSLRYKTNIKSFHSGLDLIKRLRPITFDWKDGGKHDLGLGAEDIAKIEPLLVTYNDQGKVEGVKYDRIAVVLVNAVKEQQSQIETQRKQIQTQQVEMDAKQRQIQTLQQTTTSEQSEINQLKALVCARNRRARVCRATR